MLEEPPKREGGKGGGKGGGGRGEGGGGRGGDRVVEVGAKGEMGEGGREVVHGMIKTSVYEVDGRGGELLRSIFPKGNGWCSMIIKNNNVLTRREKEVGEGVREMIDGLVEQCA